MKHALLAAQGASHTVAQRRFSATSEIKNQIDKLYGLIQELIIFSLGIKPFSNSLWKVLEKISAGPHEQVITYSCPMPGYGRQKSNGKH